MGNIASDRKNARCYSLKFSRNTDSDIIGKLDNVDSIQGYIKSLIRADMKKGEKIMKKYWLVDNALALHGEIFEKKLNCTTESEARKIAENEWRGLSEHDQQGRDEFYICRAAETEEGCLDYDTAEDFIYIKK